jgi:WD40 repeat protein
MAAQCPQLDFSTPVPSAFLCAATAQVMKDPRLHLRTALLFDVSVTQQSPICPYDRLPWGELIACHELKARIQKAFPPLAAQAALRTTSAASLRLGSSAMDPHPKPQAFGSYAARAKVSVATSPGAEKPQEQPTEGASDALRALSLSNPPADEANPTILWNKKRAHKDDIHGMRLFAGGFVTGSKDGSLLKWTRQGELSSTLYGHNEIDYKQWITAIGSNNDVVIAGSRDSFLCAWDSHNKSLRRDFFRFSPPIQAEHKSKARNQARINCIEVFDPLASGETPFFIGGPAHLHLMTVSPRGHFTNYSSTRVHKNDWAYCVEPLNREDSLGDLLVVVGAQIDLLKRNKKADPLSPRSAWAETVPIVQENHNERGMKTNYGRKQILRALIPAIHRLPTDTGKLAYSCFENNRGFGPIRIVDLDRREIVFDGQEHRGRSWQIAFPSEHVLASGADDGLIKLWDTRLSGRARFTLPQQVGRVSCLQSPGENLLLSAACPTDVRRSEDKAELTLWDLRMQTRPANESGAQ